MKQTYSEAITQVFKDEGGYSNDPGDHGGPTNWGITIIDARKYWKSDATAADVKAMPKSVAENIYRDKYAKAVGYDDLPAGVDYAVLDYGINSGTSRAIKVLKQVQKNDPVATINAIYDEREAFLRRISQNPGQGKFLKGWMSRTKRGRALALSLNSKYKNAPTVGAEHGTAAGTVLAGGVAASQAPSHLIPWIIGGTLVAAFVGYVIIKLIKGKQK